MSPYFNDKLSLFLTEVSFETSEKNQLSYFQNGYFFKILWWCHEPHNKGICRWKNEMFLNVSPLTIMDILLSLFQPIRLYYIFCSSCGRRAKFVLNMYQFFIEASCGKDIDNSNFDSQYIFATNWAFEGVDIWKKF